MCRPPSTSCSGSRVCLAHRHAADARRSGGPRCRLSGGAHASVPEHAAGVPLARILLAIGGPAPSASARCIPGRLIIGRTPANDLQIDSRFVSRHHCQIVTTAQSCVIEDLNSTNGIYLHSKRVRYHNLNDGDVVMIGQHELLYIDERGQHRGRRARAACRASAWATIGDTGACGVEPSASQRMPSRVAPVGAAPSTRRVARKSRRRSQWPPRTSRRRRSAAAPTASGMQPVAGATARAGQRVQPRQALIDRFG